MATDIWLASMRRSVDLDARSSAIHDSTSPLPPHFTMRHVAGRKVTLLLFSLGILLSILGRQGGNSYFKTNMVLRLINHIVTHRPDNSTQTY